jgi:hypothetical protein
MKLRTKISAKPEIQRRFTTKRETLTTGVISGGTDKPGCKIPASTRVMIYIMNIHIVALLSRKLSENKTCARPTYISPPEYGIPPSNRIKINVTTTATL